VQQRINIDVNKITEHPYGYPYILYNNQTWKYESSTRELSSERSYPIVGIIRDTDGREHIYIPTNLK
jgi:hypothetical protein